MLLFIQLQVTEKTLLPLSATAMEMGILSPFLLPGLHSLHLFQCIGNPVPIQPLSTLGIVPQEEGMPEPRNPVLQSNPFQQPVTRGWTKGQA